MDMNPTVARTLHFRGAVENRERSDRTGSSDSISKSLCRLISAAVVSRRFRRQLLSDPVFALASGYNGERFQLTSDEIRLICSIQATSLRSFAAQLVERANEPVTELHTAWTVKPQNDVRERIRMEQAMVPVAVGHV